MTCPTNGALGGDNMRGLLFGLATMIINIGAFAQNLRVGEPILSGTGCPQGSVTVVLSPQQTSLSLFFSEFTLQAAKGTREIQAKTCRFIVPLEVDEGFIVDAVTVDYRGFVSVPPRSVAVLATSNLLVNPRTGQRRIDRDVFQGGRTGLEQDFLVSQSSQQIRGQRCREQNQLDFTTTLSLSTLRSGRVAEELQSDALVTVDSADLSEAQSPIQIGISVAPCIVRERPDRDSDRGQGRGRGGRR